MMRSGKSNWTPPSLVGCICPATDSSPLMRTVMGAQSSVLWLATRATQRFVMAM